MGYESRRMALKMAERQASPQPTAASGDHLRLALAARNPQPDKPPPVPSAPPAAASTAAAAEKTWAADFFKSAQSSNLSLATLNAIVAVSDNQEEAVRHLTARASVPAADRSSSTGVNEAAVRRISAAHAQAHQPRQPVKRH